MKRYTSIQYRSADATNRIISTSLWEKRNSYTIEYHYLPGIADYDRPEILRLCAIGPLGTQRERRLIYESGIQVTYYLAFWNPRDYKRGTMVFS